MGYEEWKNYSHEVSKFKAFFIRRLGTKIAPNYYKFRDKYYILGPLNTACYSIKPIEINWNRNKRD